MDLLRPAFVLLIPVLIWLGWRLWHRPAGLGDWVQVVDPHLMAALRQMGRVHNGRAGQRPWILLAAAGMVAIALAGPAVPRREALVYRNLDGVIFLLDASTQTVQSTAWPGLLASLRTAIAGLGTRPAALIVYGGDAYVAVDMTYDVTELGVTAAQIGPDTLPDPGRAPARALQLAGQLVRQADLQAGDVVLLAASTPDEPALAAAATLADLPLRVSTVLPSSDGGAALRAVSGGRGAGFDLRQARDLADYLAESPYRELAEQPLPLEHLADLGRWLAGLALMPLGALFWGRRR